jgi:hypothetical protein
MESMTTFAIVRAWPIAHTTTPAVRHSRLA